MLKEDYVKVCDLSVNKVTSRTGYQPLQK